MTYVSKSFCIPIALLIVLFNFFANDIFAQVTSSAIAEQIDISFDAPNGSVLCTSQTGFELCNRTSLSTLYGVATSEPAGQLIADPTDPNTYVARTGSTQVRVNASNGTISKGDLVTSSTTEGVAVRADRNGYVLGSALQDLEGEEGLILVSVNIHFTTIFTDSRNNLLDILRDIISTPVLTPLAALRYTLAAFVSVSAFVLGFSYFGRIARTAVEAIGRNPLARSVILSTIIFNTLIMVVIFVCGLLLSYLILTL